MPLDAFDKASVFMLRSKLPCWPSWLAIAWLVGCNDLPDTSYPLLPTPSGAVVSPDDGRGSYDWLLLDGTFTVRRRLESNLFLQVDEDHVRGLIAQACSNPRVPAYQPPTWVDEQLALTIEACIHPFASIPTRTVTLPQRLLSSDTLLALNYDGSRLLLVEDQLTLWDTNHGLLLKVLPCPTRQPKFAYLSPVGDEAVVFDSHCGFLISLDGAISSSTEIFAGPIEKVVASVERDVFIVQSSLETLRLNANLQLEPLPVFIHSEQASMALTRNGKFLAILDGPDFSITDLASDAMSTPIWLRDQTAPGITVALESDYFALFAHQIFSISAFHATVPGEPRPVGPTCRTTMELDRAFPAETGRDSLDDWLTVCGQRTPVEPNGAPYQLVDLSLGEELVSLPTVIDNRKPDQLKMSDDGRVFVTASANEPIQVHFRGPRLIEHEELHALVDHLANLFLRGQASEGEELIESLESYARSVPYTVWTRKLLDLKSPVAKLLAASLESLSAPNKNKRARALQTWLESDSTMAKLVRAANQPKRQRRRGGENDDKTADSLSTRALVNEVLSTTHPPCLAFTILADMKPAQKLDEALFHSRFVEQFERDPLNPTLHMCMARFFLPENMGDIGQSEAYIEKVCEYMPAEQRDAFYSLLVTKIQQAYLFGNSDFVSSLALMHVAFIASKQSMFKVDSSRFNRGMRAVWQLPKTIWVTEFPILLWPELRRVLPFDAMELLREREGAPLNQDAFRFSFE